MDTRDVINAVYELRKEADVYTGSWSQRATNWLNEKLPKGYIPAWRQTKAERFKGRDVRPMGDKAREEAAVRQERAEHAARKLRTTKARELAKDPEEMKRLMKASPSESVRMGGMTADKLQKLEDWANRNPSKAHAAGIGAVALGGGLTLATAGRLLRAIGTKGRSVA